MTLHQELREIIRYSRNTGSIYVAREEDIISNTLTSITSALVKRVEGMKINERHEEWKDVGYNQALTDIVQLLQEKG